MFYSNNENYMQDLYSYNQIPNNTYNPYMMNTVPSNAITMGFQNQNTNFMPNMNMMGNQNPNMFQGNQNMNQMSNPNNLYPSIYRIINPVVNRVVAGTNVPYLTEDILNNMVDTVYNIIEGQVDLEEQLDSVSNNETGNRGTTTTTTTTQNSNPSTRTTTTTDTRNTMNSNITNTNTNTNTANTNVMNQTSNSRRCNRNDSLLRDLIKILILRQIFSRNWMAQMPFNYQNQFGNNASFI